MDVSVGVVEAIGSYRCCIPLELELQEIMSHFLSNMDRTKSGPLQGQYLLLTIYNKTPSPDSVNRG